VDRLTVDSLTVDALMVDSRMGSGRPATPLPTENVQVGRADSRAVGLCSSAMGRAVTDCRKWGLTESGRGGHISGASPPLCVGICRQISVSVRALPVGQACGKSREGGLVRGAHSVKPTGRQGNDRP
jgi:hypothetical protein